MCELGLLGRRSRARHKRRSPPPVVLLDHLPLGLLPLLSDQRGRPGVEHLLGILLFCLGFGRRYIRGYVCAEAERGAEKGASNEAQG